MRRIPPKIAIFVFIIAIQFVYGCKKERLIIPAVEVNISIPIEFVRNRILVEVIPGEGNFGILKYGTSDLNQVQISSPVFGNGIYIYNLDPALTPSNLTIQAYDKTCTYKAFEDYCATKQVPGISNIVECPCCKSKFLLGESYGLPITGSEAGYPLQQYNVSVLGTMIRITR